MCTDRVIVCVQMYIIGVKGDFDYSLLWIVVHRFHPRYTYRYIDIVCVRCVYGVYRVSGRLATWYVTQTAVQGITSQRPIF